MENELKNPSRNCRSEKFIWSEFLAEWKTASSPIHLWGASLRLVTNNSINNSCMWKFKLIFFSLRTVLSDRLLGTTHPWIIRCEVGDSCKLLSTVPAASELSALTFKLRALKNSELWKDFTISAANRQHSTFVL